MQTQNNIEWSNDLIEYYRNIDFSYWWEELRIIQEQYRSVLQQDNQSLRNIHNVKLYSTYLQLSEIFCLNLLALGTNNLPCLFYGNSKFEKILDAQINNEPNERKEFLNFFLDNFVFHVKEKEKIPNYLKKRELYFKIFDEAMLDRDKDKDMLNAFKHGFRTIGGGSVSLVSDTGVAITPEYDSTITYYSRGTDKDTRDIIYQHMLSFYGERVHIKCTFILNMLENARKILLAESGSSTMIETMIVNDELLDVFEKSYGVLRWKSGKFKFVTPQK